MFFNCCLDPQTLILEGPDGLNSDANADFTCKTLSTYTTSDMGIKIDSNGIDYFDELNQTSFVYTTENPMDDVIFSKQLTMTPELLWNNCNVGSIVTVECSIEDVCHGVKVYNSISKYVSLKSGSKAKICAVYPGESKSVSIKSVSI